jgi:hypothetical protein
MLLTNHSLSKCAFCLTSSLPCILPPYTLFFLTDRNMAVYKTGAAVGFLDLECFNLTMYSKAHSLIFLCPISSVPSNYMLKRNSSFPLISVSTIGL